MKLNLGCGDDILKEFTNIDIRDIKGIDIIHDLNKPLTVDNVDYIKAIDILEHFSWRDTDRIFGYWVDALKVGGKIEIFVPNIEKHIELLSENVTDKRYDGKWGYFIANVFGGQEYAENTHRTTFGPRSVLNLFDRFHLEILSFDLEGRGIRAIGKKL